MARIAFSCSCLLLLLLAAAAVTSSASKPGCPADPPFDPKTYDWKTAYSAYPVEGGLSAGLLTNPIGSVTCYAPYALCAYANCTIIHGTDPPIAECGCWVNGTTLAPNAYSMGTSYTMLSQPLQDASKKKCPGYGSDSACTSGGANGTPMSPFCPLMKRNRCGKVGMYALDGKARTVGGTFDVISTFSAYWPEGITSPMGGTGPSPQYCKTGVYTNCFSAACMLKRSWNNMPATCYCPVYRTPSFILSANSTGYECEGQSVDGVLTYVQNGI